MSDPNFPSALHLVGYELEDGWHVVQAMPKLPSQSGGNFSSSYIVERKNGEGPERGYLKALDYSAMLRDSDPARVLETQTRLYNFERNLLEWCRENQMDRIIKVISAGLFQHPRGGSPVQYLIFEMLSGGDIRKQVSLNTMDLLWKLECCKDLLNAAQQIHSGPNPISHQDIKPSNFLVDRLNGGLLADFGRAIPLHPIKEQNPFERHHYAGDPAYKPPELMYGHYDADWRRLRLGSDVYQVGSLICFALTMTTMNERIARHLPVHFHRENWHGTYVAVLPYLIHAYSQLQEELEHDLEVEFSRPDHELQPKAATDLAKQVTICISALCHPQPELRGHPKYVLGPRLNQFSLERPMSLFDKLIQIVRYKLR
jgi:eukaryotic-like serine/threonine-protein kinase